MATVRAVGRVVLLAFLLVLRTGGAAAMDGGGPDGGARDGGSDGGDAAAAAAARDAREQQVRAHCESYFNPLRYYESRPGQEQKAAAFRQQAERCMNAERTRLEWQAQQEAQMAAYYRRQAEAAARAASEQAAARAQADIAREQQSRREAAEAEADERETKARMADPAFIRAELSAQLYYVGSARKIARRKLDDQRRGARLGLGVIDKEEAYQWQGELLVMAKLERMVRSEMKAKHFSALPCKADETAEFAECIDGVRQATTLLRPGDDEYLAYATRILEYAASCTPFRRLTPEAGR